MVITLRAMIPNCEGGKLFQINGDAWRPLSVDHFSPLRPHHAERDGHNGDVHSKNQQVVSSMPPRHNGLRFLLLALIVVASSGCVREELNGSTHVYTYEWWVPLTVLVLGLVALPVGWFLKKRLAWIGWVLLILGGLSVIVFAPSLFRDRASIDDNGISLRTGIWGMTAVHDVRFEDVQRLRITAEESQGRYGRTHTNYYYQCERKDGTTQKLPMNNQVVRETIPHLMKILADRGIPVLDER